MKKTKLLTPLLVASALATPTVSFLTGCSKVNYTAITETIKDTMIDEFLQLAKVPRMTWMGHEAYLHIQDRMEQFGLPLPTGTDEKPWSDCPEAQEQINLTKQEYSWIQDTTRRSYWGEYGNMWYDLPATPGYEDAPIILIQSHYDMNITFNPTKLKEARESWLKNGIKVDYNKSAEKITTDGNLTSLGADNGVGVSLALSLAKHRSEFRHGRIRLMFTPDESGATPNYYSGSHYLVETQKSTTLSDDRKPFTDVKYILNLDGNVEGHVFTSVAGLHECQTIKTNIEPEALTAAGVNRYKLKISGLTGGHSAYDINKGYANALQLLMQILASTDTEKFQIEDLWCNSGAYQICSEAEATVWSELGEEDFNNNVESYTNIFKSLYSNEPNLSIVSTKLDSPQVGDTAFPAKLSRQVLFFTNILNYGPCSWYDNPAHQIVKTSLNFGPLKVSKNQNKYDFDCHVVERSADANELKVFANLIHGYIKSLMNAFNFTETEIIHTDDPAWQEDPSNNPLSALLVEGYKKFKLGGSRDSSHAWLEFSAFPIMFKAAGLPEPCMAAIGPTILHSHEITEETHTDTFDAAIKGILYVSDFSKNLK